MKKFNFIFLLIILISGCAPIFKTLPVPPRPTSREFNYDINKIYNELIKQIALYPITSIDKDNWIIVTDWRDYLDTSDVHVTQWGENGSSDILHIPVEVKDKLTVFLSENNNKTTVDIKRTVKIRPYKIVNYYQKLWIPDQDSDFSTTKSNTLVEDRILNKLTEKFK